MGKISVHTLNKKDQLLLQKDLWATLDRLNEKGVQHIFLSKLFTDSEEVMFARRIQIARFLLNGVSKLEIQRRLGVGQATVDWVSKWVRSDLRETEKAVLSLRSKSSTTPQRNARRRTGRTRTRRSRQ